MFLDRDGVINEVLSSRVKFVNKPDEFYLLDGVGVAIKQFKDAGFKVFVVTNQGGVGLGYMREDTLHAIHEKMIVDLSMYGASVDEITYCPHKPHANCICRKPNPQMILDLAEKYDINLSKSYMIGDRKPDIEAGMLAGTQTVLVGDREKSTDASLHFSNLLSFSNWICLKK